VSFPPPDPTPLARLHVYDGLMMNAKRWQVMEAYHRRRQNLQYQSLHQPGIVCGLGVRVVSAPDSVESKFQDDRWLEIQPGIAIDLEGNPIIVASSSTTTSSSSKDDLSLKFRIKPTPPSGHTLTIYVVVSYSEPTAPPSRTEELIREWFRFDQLTHPPNAHQVELCRIELQNPVVLENPAQVLFPTLNELDFRHRQQATIRPRSTIQVAQLIPSENFNESSDLATVALYQNSAENLADLIQAMEQSSDSLPGILDIAQVSLPTENLSQWDVLYIPDGQALRQFTDPQIESLKDYVQQGGGLFVEALVEPLDKPSLESTAEQLAETEQIDDIVSLQQLLQKVLPDNRETSFVRWDSLSRYHSLRRSPFLFGALPEIQSQPIQLYASDGIVLVSGRLSSAWGLAEAQLPRSEIRTAQELGINLLHFLWQRRRLTQLMQWDAPAMGST
jgi:Domain of unknown function (DUF4159)